MAKRLVLAGFASALAVAPVLAADNGHSSINPQILLNCIACDGPDDSTILQIEQQQQQQQQEQQQFMDNAQNKFLSTTQDVTNNKTNANEKMFDPWDEVVSPGGAGYSEPFSSFGPMAALPFGGRPRTNYAVSGIVDALGRNRDSFRPTSTRAKTSGVEERTIDRGT